MPIQNLRDFLISFNEAGYASGNENMWTKEQDGSTSINYENKEFRAHDNFFGGEPYGGREVVFFNNKPSWMMVYYGWVIEDFDKNEVYRALRHALKNQPHDFPVRGPKEIDYENFTYINNWSGNLNRFSGKETISQNGKIIYEANYMGGLIDINKGG
jgi:hypothetical protein